MPDNASQKDQRWQALEFSLVVVMLCILCVLVMSILFGTGGTPPTPNIGSNATPDQVLKYQEQLFLYEKATNDYRKDVLSIILTAFGAWVGAGAAYFFGRENLRDANSLLLQREASPKDLLNQAKVSELPLRALEPIVKQTDSLRPVIERLKADNKLWFVAVINAQGQLVDVIHKEGIWRYVVDHATDAATATIQTVMDFLRADQALKKNFLGVYVPVKIDSTVGQAHDLMVGKDKEVYISIVVNSDSKPMYYFDTADVRKFLLK